MIQAARVVSPLDSYSSFDLAIVLSKLELRAKNKERIFNTLTKTLSFHPYSDTPEVNSNAVDRFHKNC